MDFKFKHDIILLLQIILERGRQIMNAKLEIFIVEDDASICEDFARQISDTEDMVLIGTTNNSATALKYIKDYEPDIIILALELHLGCGNGLSILQEISKLNLNHKPYILITTNNSSSTTHEIARTLGADFIMSKHQEGYSNTAVLEFLKTINSAIKQTSMFSLKSADRNIETNEQHTRRINRHIMTELNHVGINPKSIGYTYLTDAIMIMSNHPTQNISTKIAEKYSKSEASVERAMQNAINRAWKVNDLNELLQYYTAKISSVKGNPTITEFICYYANKIRNEY